MAFRTAVYCGSSRETEEDFLLQAFQFGKILAEEGIEIVYGGGKAGMMGSLAEGALSAGGRVTGVIPFFLENLELGNRDIAELLEVSSMHERQRVMMERSDCIVALPGGIGTFAELTEAIAWKKLGLIISPIIIVNYKNYYKKLVEQLEVAVDTGFMYPGNGSVWHIASNAESAFALILKLKSNK